MVLPSPSSVWASLSKVIYVLKLGGGDKGAYEVGVLKGFLQEIPDKIHYDVASGKPDLKVGVSVGSLNSIGFAVYEKGDEAAMIQYLGRIWYNLKRICGPKFHQEMCIKLGQGFLVFYEVSLTSLLSLITSLSETSYTSK